MTSELEETKLDNRRKQKPTHGHLLRCQKENPCRCLKIHNSLHALDRKIKQLPIACLQFYFSKGGGGRAGSCWGLKGVISASKTRVRVLWIPLLPPDVMGAHVGVPHRGGARKCTVWLQFLLVIFSLGEGWRCEWPTCAKVDPGSR